MKKLKNFFSNYMNVNIFFKINNNKLLYKLNMF